MKLYVWKGDVPNFGDELNSWLMPKVFPRFFDDEPDPMFLGIGSILFNHHPEQPLKIVFGSGYGQYTRLPDFNDKWAIYCVRGPRTAEACGLGSDKVAGDAAILIKKFFIPDPHRNIKCSFMPHWESAERGGWPLACRLADIHFIDPRSSVEQVLAEIKASRVVLTEAMHGAIVADALRVPWIPVRPFNSRHRFKWVDWAEALDMGVAFQRPWPSSTREAWSAFTHRNGVKIDRVRQSSVGRPVLQIADRTFAEVAARWLRQAIRSEPVLSSDRSLDRAIDLLETSAAKISRDFS